MIHINVKIKTTNQANQVPFLKILGAGAILDNGKIYYEMFEYIDERKVTCYYKEFDNKKKFEDFIVYQNRKEALISYTELESYMDSFNLIKKDNTTYSNRQFINIGKGVLFENNKVVLDITDISEFSHIEESLEFDSKFALESYLSVKYNDKVFIDWDLFIW